MLAYMGTLFGDRLTSAREAAGLSGYRLVQLTGIAQGNLQAIERGRRQPSDANLDALAGVSELGVELEQLQAWRDLDRLGLDGLGRIKKWIPDAWEMAQAPATTGADPVGAVLAQVPDGVRSKLKASEVTLLSSFAGCNLSDFDLGPDSYVWALPWQDRLRVLKQSVKDLEEAGAFAAKRESLG